MVFSGMSAARSERFVRGERVMAEHANYCPACSLWHEPPVPCSHEPEAPCLEGCGRIRGFRWLGDDRREVKPRIRCWACWATKEGLIGPRPAEVAA